MSRCRSCGEQRCDNASVFEATSPLSVNPTLKPESGVFDDDDDDDDGGSLPFNCVAISKHPPVL